MGRIGWTLSAVFIAAAVAGGMVFLSYSNDIDRAAPQSPMARELPILPPVPSDMPREATAFRSFPSTAQTAIIRSVEPLSRRFPGINIDSAPDLHRLPLEKIAAPTLVVSAQDDLFNTLPAALFAAKSYDTGHLLVGQGGRLRKSSAISLLR